ncbi:MAG: hypothetical protein NZ957_02220 [Thaumarchaeota archaeon]|nr:hypothetical protein [Candidatus Calditenuaceae archaeon]
MTDTLKDVELRLASLEAEVRELRKAIAKLENEVKELRLELEDLFSKLEG